MYCAFNNVLHLCDDAIEPACTEFQDGCCGCEEEGYCGIFLGDRTHSRRLLQFDSSPELLNVDPSQFRERFSFSSFCPAQKMKAQLTALVEEQSLNLAQPGSAMKEALLQSMSQTIAANPNTFGGLAERLLAGNSDAKDLASQAEELLARDFTASKRELLKVVMETGMQSGKSVASLKKELVAALAQSSSGVRTDKLVDLALGDAGDADSARTFLAKIAALEGETQAGRSVAVRDLAKLALRNGMTQHEANNAIGEAIAVSAGTNIRATVSMLGESLNPGSTDLATTLMADIVSNSGDKVFLESYRQLALAGQRKIGQKMVGSLGEAAKRTVKAVERKSGSRNAAAGAVRPTAAQLGSLEHLKDAYGDAKTAITKSAEQAASAARSKVSAGSYSKSVFSKGYHAGQARASVSKAKGKRINTVNLG